MATLSSSSPSCQAANKQSSIRQKCLNSEIDCVRKNLFCCEEESEQFVDIALVECSSSSDYFSQSSMDLEHSSASKRLLFESPSQEESGWSMSFATPLSSPPQPETPLHKRQRLFSPDSSEEDSFRPTKLATCLFSPSSTGSPDYDSDNSERRKHKDVMSVSPPRLERLQLFDYPRTPLSIARSSGVKMRTPTKSIQRPTKSLHSRLSRSQLTRSGPELARRPSRGTNVNPFTPVELQRKSRSAHTTPAAVSSTPYTSTPLFDNNIAKPHKKLALRESNISRYKEEFHEVCEIGSGTFGTVYKCINRLDGCVYALKRSHEPVAGSVGEAAALREVCAHAVLGSHPHLVRYYSAWAEDNHMLIQNEFCNGGNLSSRIAHNSSEGKAFSEKEIKRLLRHICLGLQYIHSMGMVHLDIKPDNIFISLSEPHLPSALTAIAEEAYSEEWELVYKIGDMGLVTSVSDPQVEEGDCRYLPREILQENFSNLPQVDVFALGLTAYSAGSSQDLPKNGADWHRIRDGYLEPLPGCSEKLNQLLLHMIHPDPASRPSTTELLALPIVCATTQKSKAQLCKELNEEKFKNEMLTRELQEARTVGSTQKPVVGLGRVTLGGTKLNRSMSIA